MEEVFEVRLGEEADNRSLQDAFKTFREKRRVSNLQCRSVCECVMSVDSEASVHLPVLPD